MKRLRPSNDNSPNPPPLERRDLKKGQKAMALAMLYPEPRRGRGNKDEARKVLETRDFSRQRLEQARSVLRHSAALAEDVLNDRVPLDKALEQIKSEQRYDRRPAGGRLCRLTQWRHG